MFSGITDKENQQLIDAIAQITVLIAGADGKIEEEETEWAEKLTRIRSYSFKDILKPYYADVGEGFSRRLKELIIQLPDSTDPRTQVISENLEKLNSILAKLDNKTAYHLYDSWLTFAEHVAKSAGGFLRFGSVSGAEKKLIGLNMLTPIELIPPEEEIIEPTDY